MDWMAASTGSDLAANLVKHPISILSMVIALFFLDWIFAVCALFVFPLWIEWREGREKKRMKLVIEEKIQDFNIPVSEKPKNIVINPHEAVPGNFR